MSAQKSLTSGLTRVWHVVCGTSVAGVAIAALALLMPWQEANEILGGSTDSVATDVVPSPFSLDSIVHWRKRVESPKRRAPVMLATKEVELDSGVAGSDQIARLRRLFGADQFTLYAHIALQNPDSPALGTGQVRIQTGVLARNVLIKDVVALVDGLGRWAANSPVGPLSNLPLELFTPTNPFSYLTEGWTKDPELVRRFLQDFGGMMMGGTSWASYSDFSSLPSLPLELISAFAESRLYTIAESNNFGSFGINSLEVGSSSASTASFGGGTTGGSRSGAFAGGGGGGGGFVQFPSATVSVQVSSSPAEVSTSAEVGQ